MSQREDLKGAISLSLQYLKQETVEPLRSLVGMVVWGVISAIVTAFGVILVALGLLRLLQSETGSSFQGHLNWLPYLITLVIVGIALVGVVSRIGKRRS